MEYQQFLIRIMAVLLAMIPAASQVLEKRLTPVDNTQAAKFNKADTVGVAILVGVSKYPRYSGLSELRYPAVDVDTLAATLKGQRYLVLTLKDADATKGSILNAIQQAGEAMAGENLTAIFFSGHGFAVNGQNYLATQDANSRDFAASGLSVKAVEDELVKTHATRRVMWIDACRVEPHCPMATLCATNPFAKHIIFWNCAMPATRSIPPSIFRRSNGTKPRDQRIGNPNPNEFSRTWNGVIDELQALKPHF